MSKRIEGNVSPFEDIKKIKAKEKERNAKREREKKSAINARKIRRKKK